MWKQKIIAAFKVKYPASNLSETRLNEIAVRIEAKVKDESEIDAMLDSFNEFMPFDQIAREDDAMRNLQAQAKKPATKTPAELEAEKAAQKAANPGKEEPPTDAMPAWAKSLLDEVKGLKAEKAKDQINDLVTGKLKEVPAIFWNKRALPGTVEEIEAFVLDVNTDYKDFTKDATDKKFTNIAAGKGGAGKSTAGMAAGKQAAGDKNNASKEELDGVMKNIKV